VPGIPRRADLNQLWGPVQRAVNDPAVRAQPGGITQAVWQSYYADLQAGRVTGGPLTIFDVNALVSRASEQRNARGQLAGAIDTFQRTGLDQALSGNMFARDLDAGPGAGFTQAGNFRIRFEANYSVEGETLRRFSTHVAGLNMPQSVAGLLDLLDLAGESDATDYGVEYLGGIGGIDVTYV
jgi:hypothetical protein